MKDIEIPRKYTESVRFVEDDGLFNAVENAS